MSDEKLDVVWGAKGIGEEIGTDKRRTYYLLERGKLLAKKVGDRWYSTRQVLRQHMLSGLVPNDGGLREMPLNIGKGPATAVTVDRLDKLSDQPHPETPGSGTWQGLAYPMTAELEWLFAHGVPPDAMAEPCPIRSARVVFDGLHGFDFTRDGEPAIIFKAEDRGEEIDLIAWQPITGKLASWRGVAFCLGDFDDVFNPGTYFADGALHVHETPLQWLRAEREGIVILRRDFAYAHLRFCPQVRVADAIFGRQLEQWIQPPTPTCKILVEVRDERQAA